MIQPVGKPPEVSIFFVTLSLTLDETQANFLCRCKTNQTPLYIGIVLFIQCSLEDCEKSTMGSLIGCGFCSEWMIAIFPKLGFPSFSITLVRLICFLSSCRL